MAERLSHLPYDVWLNVELTTDAQLLARAGVVSRVPQLREEAEALSLTSSERASRFTGPFPSR